MAGYRDLVFKYANRGAELIPTSWLIRLSRQKLILPFYHTVSDYSLPHLKHLYPIKNVQTFSEDLDFLLKHFQPIDFFEFQKLVNNNIAPKKPSFLLSFDDGLKEIENVIAPILLRKGVPAIFFLNSAFVDNKDLFFRYKASLLIDAYENNQQNLDLNAVQLFFKNLGKENIDFSTALLSVNYSERSWLDDLANLMQISFSDFLEKQQPYLTSPQINSLIKKGFYFGAHSVDHPEYQFIEEQEQVRQTIESIDFVKQKFDLNYRTFSFPFTDYGVNSSFFSNIKKERNINFTFGTAGQKKDNVSNHFQRIPFEVNQLDGRAVLNNELLYYILKTPFGKNTINRK